MGGGRVVDWKMPTAVIDNDKVNTVGRLGTLTGVNYKNDTGGLYKLISSDENDNRLWSSAKNVTMYVTWHLTQKIKLAAGYFRQKKQLSNPGATAVDVARFKTVNIYSDAGRTNLIGVCEMSNLAPNGLNPFEIEQDKQLWTDVIALEFIPYTSNLPESTNAIGPMRLFGEVYNYWVAASGGINSDFSHKFKNENIPWMI